MSDTIEALRHHRDQLASLYASASGAATRALNAYAAARKAVEQAETAHTPQEGAPDHEARGRVDACHRQP